MPVLGRSKLGKQIEKELNSQARSVEDYGRTAEQMIEVGHPQAADSALRNFQMQQAELDGMGKLAFRLGFRCDCDIKTGKKGVTSCKCTKRKTSKQKYTFDGKRCRDPQGAFVPVGQCKGEVGRDEAGRFVSIK